MCRPKSPSSAQSILNRAYAVVEWRYGHVTTHTYSHYVILATDGFMHNERPYRNGFPFVAHVYRLLHSRSIHNKFIFTLGQWPMSKLRYTQCPLRFVLVRIAHVAMSVVFLLSPLTGGAFTITLTPPKNKMEIFVSTQQLRLFQLNLNCLRRFVCRKLYSIYLNMLDA